MVDYSKWIVPRKGLLVRDPRTKTPLPEQGMYKPWTGPEGRYWRRRLICGDVTLGEAPVAKPEIETVKETKNSKRRK